jgi:hypothetical protein
MAKAPGSIVSLMNILNTLLIPVYCNFCNIIFDNGIIPEKWTEGIIIPIFKNNGDENKPENYRPITLLSCLGKLFTAIINNRLNKFVEENEVIRQCQAGFRKKNHSTIYNIFVLQCLIDMRSAQNKKLFCVFIDFKKAFDTVWRNGLWFKLVKNNINGKCLNIIKNMYSNIKSKIKTNQSSSGFFPCLSGERQGANLSPLLFSLYLNDLETYFCNTNGIECRIDHENIYINLIN